MSKLNLSRIDVKVNVIEMFLSVFANIPADKGKHFDVIKSWQ